MNENQTSKTGEARPAVASTDGLDDLPGALLLAKGVAEQKWPHTVDARAWTDEWLRTLKEHPEIATDRDTMIGWFANSIMAGYDTAMFRSSNSGKGQTQFVITQPPKLTSPYKDKLE